MYGFAPAIHQNGASVIRWAWRFAGAKPPYAIQSIETNPVGWCWRRKPNIYGFEYLNGRAAR
jgi:hypothetical protein